MKLSKNQKLFLRMIVACGMWTPSAHAKGSYVEIPDGSGDRVELNGGASARSLASLVERGLITKPYSYGWHCLSPTELGEKIIADMKASGEIPKEKVTVARNYPPGNKRNRL